MCLNETRDVTSAAGLAVIARFSSEDQIKQKLIKWMKLSEKTIEDMNDLKKEFIELGINFGNIVSVTSYGAPNMIEKIMIYKTTETGSQPHFC